MTSAEETLLGELRAKGIEFSPFTWESCRNWLTANEWKINVLSDYPGGEIKFTVRRGFERIELTGRSDLEVMAKAILEIKRRDQFQGST